MPFRWTSVRHGLNYHVLNSQRRDEALGAAAHFPILLEEIFGASGLKSLTRVRFHAVVPGGGRTGDRRPVAFSVAENAVKTLRLLCSGCAQAKRNGEKRGTAEAVP